MVQMLESSLLGEVYHLLFSFRIRISPISDNRYEDILYYTETKKNQYLSATQLIILLNF